MEEYGGTIDIDTEPGGGHLLHPDIYPKGDKI